MKYGFHPEALAEYEGAALHYATRDPRVAARFIEAVEDAVRRIRATPTRWRIVEQDIRRCLLRVFPYAILYTIERDRVLIVAVMHCSREPRDWKARGRKA
jgi:plasmid stabilization system protein ParE